MVTTLLSKSQTLPFSSRFDEENDKYYLINNEDGAMKVVNKNGDFIKTFNVKLTGQVGYEDRIRMAQNVTS